jgi:hypothetical protein
MTTPATDTPASPAQEGTWQKYKRLGEIEARPWTEADANTYFALSRDTTLQISVSQADELTALKSPAVGMVARNPVNHADQWYIAPDYFAKHYAPAAIAPPKEATQVALTEGQRALVNRVAGEYELRARGALFPEAYREFRKDAAELREIAKERM